MPSDGLVGKADVKECAQPAGYVPRWRTDEFLAVVGALIAIEIRQVSTVSLRP